MSRSTSGGGIPQFTLDSMLALADIARQQKELGLDTMSVEEILSDHGVCFYDLMKDELATQYLVENGDWDFVLRVQSRVEMLKGHQNWIIL